MFTFCRSQIRLGDTNISSITPNSVIRDISTRTVHPKYIQNQAYYDVVVWTLDGDPLIFSDKISPVCLPPTHQDDVNFRQGQNLTVSGWGVHKSGKPIDGLLKSAPIELFSNRLLHEKQLL